MNLAESLSIRAALLFGCDRPHVDAHVRPYSRRPDLLRLQPGVYAPLGEWKRWDSESRHLARLHAALLVRRNPMIVSGESAAAVWGYPRIGAFPTEVHLTTMTGPSAHNGPGVRVHRDLVPPEDLSSHRGLTLTSPARTLIDLARTASAMQSLAAVDSALRRRPNEAGSTTKADLCHQLGRVTTKRGTARARWVVEFSDGGAANPGESWSRLRIAELGFVPARLQTEHPNPLGGRYYTDFEWPELRLIGEFDGKGKYLKPEYLGSLTPGEAVYREKRREDHLRDRGYRFVRWGWPELEHSERLASLLSGAGVPRLRPAR
ncbi:hypothetical protein [Subtercola boreus]|nr:hypothetical protein [Subtercola boreus]